MKKSTIIDLKIFLDEKVRRYNQPEFIKSDPVSIPHLFRKKQDIEIAGFFASIFAWGGRPTIINKSKELMQLMDMAPHDFCLHHQDTDLKKLMHFKHRTFNTTDLLYCIAFMKHHYSKHKSLEDAFFPTQVLQHANGHPVKTGLIYFHEYFFSLEDAPHRTRKHIATPYKNSGCKRLNMYLRWMVRRDNHGVDFGIWKKISPADLICPIDLHVARVAKSFQLLHRKDPDWIAAEELTKQLRQFDSNDPVQYDFALFALGVMEKYR